MRSALTIDGAHESGKGKGVMIRKSTENAFETLYAVKKKRFRPDIASLLSPQIAGTRSSYFLASLLSLK